ncbi:MAG: hypothetical protein FJX75_25335 [Armatimonadetes bacterium]|nr:hypothetical protein [Armatimonadota bacterium]
MVSDSIPDFSVPTQGRPSTTVSRRNFPAGWNWFVWDRPDEPEPEVEFVSHRQTVARPTFTRRLRQSEQTAALQSEVETLRSETWVLTALLKETQEDVVGLEASLELRAALMASIAGHLMPVEISEVVDGDTRLCATAPLLLSVESHDGMVSFEHPSLGIVSHSGESYDDAEQRIAPQLAWLWRTYAMAQDDELSADAMELKQALLSIFRES